MGNYEFTTIPFQIRQDLYEKLGERARLHGFKAATEYMRWLLEREAGFGETTNMRALNRMIISPLERVILEALRERPQTKPEIAEAFHKHVSSIQVTAASMLHKLWIKVDGEKYTGGRQAVIYAATDLGLQKLDQELARRVKLEEQCEASRRADMAASAAADLSRKPKRTQRLGSNDKTTEPGQFLQAVLDAIYDHEDKTGKTYTDAQVIAWADAEKLEAEADIIGGEIGTWAERIERVKRDGWVEPAPTVAPQSEPVNP